VKTGVQEVLKASKILDSGFRRNDRKRPEPDFFTPSGRAKVGVNQKIFPLPFIP